MKKFKVGDRVLIVSKEAGPHSIVVGKITCITLKDHFPFEVAWTVRGEPWINSDVFSEAELVPIPKKATIKQINVLKHVFKIPHEKEDEEEEEDPYQ